MTQRQKSLVLDRRGAVIAEFIIAIMPISMLFLCLCEIARYSLAKMAMQHGAMIGVRACSVIKKQPGEEKKVDGEEADIENGIKYAMKPWLDDSKSLKIKFPAECEVNAPSGTDRLTLEATYQCNIPLARNIVCLSGPKHIKVEARMPHQGANYKLE